MTYIEREHVCAQAKRRRHEPGYSGEAWCYVYELAGKDKSQAWLRTMLQRAANDHSIMVAKRNIYQECADALC